MKNITTKVENGKLVITVDLKKEFGPSKSGKTTIIASTEGNPAVEGTTGIFFGVNVYKK